MSNYLTTLRSSRETFRIPLDEFLKKCDPLSQKTTYCFVEGTEDKWFYNSKIRSRLHFSPYTISCKSKKNVLSVYQELNARESYKSVKIGYFVDRDFSDQVPINLAIDWNDVYITPFYSIENFYLQPETVQAILDEVFNLQEGSNDFNKALTFFNDLSKSFHQKTLQLNVFLCCQFTIDVDVNKLNIDDRLGNLFNKTISADLAKVSDLKKIDDKLKLEQLFETSVVPIELWDKTISYFRVQDGAKVFRGKFEIRFLYDFLTTLKESLLTGQLSGWTRVYKPEVRIIREELLKNFVDKIITPSCLIQYIERLH